MAGPPFYVAIETSDMTLDNALEYEPTGSEEIPRVKSRRLSKLDHYRGLPGVILTWKTMPIDQWAHLNLVSGGRGVASADAYLRFIDLEDTSGNEVWCDFACIADKPLGGLSEESPGMLTKVTMTLRELVKLGESV